MKTGKIFFLTVFLALSAAFLPAQEDESAVYVIRELEFDITGRTRPFALISRGGFKEGERVNGKRNFDRYIADKTRLLRNERTLEATARIEYFLGEREADGAFPVKLLIHAEDTTNFIIIPYPKYSSDDGASITLKVRDYNFLGTMAPLRIDLGYRQDGEEKFLNFMLDISYPFAAAGLEWNVFSVNSLEYEFDEPLYFQNTTGVSVNVPWHDTYLTFGAEQQLTFNQAPGTEAVELYGTPGERYSPYASTRLYTSWYIPFDFEVGGFGKLGYTAGLSGKANYPYGKMEEPRKPSATLSQNLGFGKIDWIGNFRKGAQAGISNSYDWFFDRDDAPVRITFDASAVIHWPFSKYIGVSSRLQYRQWWQQSGYSERDFRYNGWIPHYSGGDVIRGVPNDDLRVEKMLSFNIDVPVRVLRFWPSEWFNNRKLRLFDFEMFFSPFMDMALAEGPYFNALENPWEGVKFSPGDVIHTGGLEVIAYSGLFRSVQLRGSVGYDLQKLRDEGLTLKWGFFPQWSEIFIGLELAY